MNKPMSPRTARLGCWSSLVLLAACGGGGGNGGNAPVAPAPAPPTASAICTNGARYAVYAPSTATTGQNVAAAVASCVGTGSIGSPKWTQTAGPMVDLLSDKTQTLSFEPLTVGTYGFRVAFVDPDGVARSQDVSINVEGTLDANRLVLRASQSVRMGGNVSLRAWPQAPTGPITWQQIEGPTVRNLNTTDDRVALFVAPDVTRDTVVRFRATTAIGGTSKTSEATVLVERYQQAADTVQNLWGGSHVSRVYAYKPASPYAGVLARCVYDASLTDSSVCPLSQLPFLAQTVGAGTPTVEQIMDRVVVSHDWLGRNFENFLRTQDRNDDFKRMLKSVTAVVLGVQVRPSFYYAGSGAIYLDGDNFWLTPEERDTINEAPDFRSNFGAALNYSGLWRYVRNNQSVFRFFDPQVRTSRDLAYLLDESGWLMYHELAHALDFLPPSAYASLNSAKGAWANIEPRFSAKQITSDTVPARFPLTSTVMPGLGQVKFQGVTATATQIAYTPAQVGAFFAADVATDEYAYSTPREDVAMAIEEALMASRLGVRRDVAMTSKITDNSTRDTILVGWGQRGRVGEAAIKPRVRAIAAELTPWFEPAAIDAIAAPTFMRVGESWFANLSQPAPTGQQKPSMMFMSKAERYQLKREIERALHSRHLGAPKLPGGAGESTHRH